MLQYRRAWLTGGWLLVVCVWYLSLTPIPPQPFTFSFADKFEHGFAYASLSLWFCQIYLQRKARVELVLWLVAMGVLIEILQGLSGYRYFEYADMLANSTGVLIGWLLARTAFGRLFVWIESRAVKHGN